MKKLFPVSTFLLMTQLSFSQSSADSIAEMCRPQFYFTIESVPESLSLNPEGEITIRSCRSENCYYYIDGIKVRLNEATDNIEEVTVITGGIPVNYGDINSSIIRIEERNKPESTQFSGFTNTESFLGATSQ